MKSFWLYLFFVFILCSEGYGQNLVPNGSFEQDIACPDTFQDGTGSNISAAKYWFNAGGFTPDYFNPCDTNYSYPWYGAPLNQYGYQNARTGNSYGGIITSWFYSGDSVREYIEVKLTDSLRAGNQYIVSFFVSLGDSSYYASNSLGVYFSHSAITFSSYPYPLPVNPQIQNNPVGNPLTNRLSWIEIRDTIIASGGEQYIIIGNFNGDFNTDTTQMNDIPAGQGDPWSYYYIDDVSVVCVGCTVGINKNIPIENKINVYPNPAYDFINVKAADNNFISRVELINIIGDLVFSIKISSVNTISLNLSDIQKGIYLLKTTDINGLSSLHKIIID